MICVSSGFTPSFSRKNVIYFRRGAKTADRDLLALEIFRGFYFRPGNQLVRVELTIPSLDKVSGG
jgi:hypothetical protein